MLCIWCFQQRQGWHSRLGAACLQRQAARVRPTERAGSLQQLQGGAQRAGLDEYLYYLAFKDEQDLQEQFRQWGYIS
jgi:hypothetical protein